MELVAARSPVRWWVARSAGGDAARAALSATGSGRAGTAARLVILVAARVLVMTARSLVMMAAGAATGHITHGVLAVMTTVLVGGPHPSALPHLLIHLGEPQMIADAALERSEHFIVGCDPAGRCSRRSP